MKILLLTLILSGCATSVYNQVGGEVPHYGLSEFIKGNQVCFVYSERNNGVAVSCIEATK